MTPKFSLLIIMEHCRLTFLLGDLKHFFYNLHSNHISVFIAFSSLWLAFSSIFSANLTSSFCFFFVYLKLPFLFAQVIPCYICFFIICVLSVCISSFFFGFFTNLLLDYFFSWTDTSYKYLETSKWYLFTDYPHCATQQQTLYMSFHSSLPIQVSSDKLDHSGCHMFLLSEKLLSTAAVPFCIVRRIFTT